MVIRVSTGQMGRWSCGIGPMNGCLKGWGTFNCFSYFKSVIVLLMLDYMTKNIIIKAKSIQIITLNLS
jgi:hypothetical protein